MLNNFSQAPEQIWKKEITYNTTECQKNAKTNSEIMFFDSFAWTVSNTDINAIYSWVPQKNMQLYKFCFYDKKNILKDSKQEVNHTLQNQPNKFQLVSNLCS